MCDPRSGPGLFWDCFGKEIANRYYQAFKWATIAHLPEAEWWLSEEKVRAMVRAIQVSTALEKEEGER